MKIYSQENNTTVLLFFVKLNKINKTINNLINGVLSSLSLRQLFGVIAVKGEYPLYFIAQAVTWWGREYYDEPPNPTTQAVIVD